MSNVIKIEREREREREREDEFKLYITCVTLKNIIPSNNLL